MSGDQEMAPTLTPDEFGARMHSQSLQAVFRWPRTGKTTLGRSARFIPPCTCGIARGDFLPGDDLCERHAAVGIEFVTLCSTPRGEVLRYHVSENYSGATALKALALSMGFVEPLIVGDREFIAVRHHSADSLVVAP